MAHSTDIVAYDFKADRYCSGCIIWEVKKANPNLEDVPGIPPWDSAEEELDEFAADLEIDRENEESYDSSDFPKVVFSDELDRATLDGESGEVCGSCGNELS